MWTLAFWQAAGERAVATFAQTFVGLYGTDALGWLNVDLGQTAVVSGIAAGLSVLKSLIVTSATGELSIGRHEAVQSKVSDDR